MDHRHRDLGVRLPRYAQICGQAERRDDEDQHRHARAVADREVREPELPARVAHDCAPPRATTLTTSPCVTWFWPTTTTRSLADNPDSTTTRFAVPLPVITGVICATRRPCCSCTVKTA